MRYRSIVVAVSALIGAGVAFAFQWVPSLNVLNHEFTQWFSVVCCFVIYYLSASVANHAQATSPAIGNELRLSQAWGTIVLASFAVALGGFLLNALFTIYVHHCQYRNGIPFFWMTSMPLLLFTGLLGLMTGWWRWRWWKRTLLLAFVVVLSMFADYLQFHRGCAIVDFFIGCPLLFDQRADMTVPPVHLYQRGMLLLLTWALWKLFLWRNCENQADGSDGIPARVASYRNQGMLGVLVFGAIVCGAGSYVGIGWGKGKTYDTLSQTRTSEHFVFRYAPSGQADLQMERIERCAEWYWTHVSSLLELRPERKVEVLITESGRMTRNLSGMADAHAHPWALMIPVHSATTSTMLHELTHALDTKEARSQLTPTQAMGWRVHEFLNFLMLRGVFFRGRVEGLAQSVSESYASLPEAHRSEALALNEGTLPGAGRFMGFDGFKKIVEGNAYNLAGSFLGFLRMTYGPDRLKAFLDTREDYVAAFGKNLSELDREWREFLATVPGREPASGNEDLPHPVDSTVSGQLLRETGK